MTAVEREPLQAKGHVLPMAPLGEPFCSRGTLPPKKGKRAVLGDLVTVITTLHCPRIFPT